MHEASPSSRADIDPAALHRRWFEPAGGAPADGSPVVLLHEGLGSISAWGRFPQRLADVTGRPVLAYDRIGYGRSAPWPGPWPARFMHEEARLLGALLDDEGIGRAVLVGHSDGASIALLYPSQVPASNTEIVGIVSISAHVFVEPIGLRAIVELRAGYRDGMDALLARHHGDADALFEAWSEVWVSDRFRTWVIDPELAAVRCPVLTVQGADDGYGTAEQVERVATAVHGPAEVVLLPGADHWPHKEVPDDLLAAIQRFCANL